MNKYNIYMVAYDGATKVAKILVDQSGVGEDPEKIVEDIDKGHHRKQSDIEELAVAVKGFYRSKFISIGFMKETM